MSAREEFRVLVPAGKPHGLSLTSEESSCEMTFQLDRILLKSERRLNALNTYFIFKKCALN